MKVAESLSKTPDVTLSFALWLGRARRSPWVNLLYRIRDLGRVRIWDFGETGGFSHRYDSEIETFYYTNHEHPASYDARVTYYQEAELPLHRPSPLNLTDSP